MTNLDHDTKIDNNLQLYDDYYDKPEWWFRYRYDTQVKKKTVIQLIKSSGIALTGKSVFEIGFGSGEVLFSFDKSCQIYGVELSRSAISEAEQKASQRGYKAFSFKNSEGGRLPFSDNQFDVVIASHVLEHVDDDHQVIKEIQRVLKPGGVAVFLVPINEKYSDPNHVRKYTTTGFDILLKECNFAKVEWPVENMLLYRMVEKFYVKRYNQRWKILGPVIVAAFNIPTSLLSYSLNLTIDRLLIRMGWLPMQYGCIVHKE